MGPMGIGAMAQKNYGIQRDGCQDQALRVIVIIRNGVERTYYMDKKDLLALYGIVKKVQKDSTLNIRIQSEFPDIDSVIKSIEKELLEENDNLNKTLSILINSIPNLSSPFTTIDTYKIINAAIKEITQAIIESDRQRNSLQKNDD